MINLYFIDTNLTKWRFEIIWKEQTCHFSNGTIIMKQLECNKTTMFHENKLLNRHSQNIIALNTEYSWIIFIFLIMHFTLIRILLVQVKAKVAPNFFIYTSLIIFTIYTSIR